MGKRFFDFALAFVCLVLLFPFFFVLSLMIKSSSPGPIFQKHKRLGKGFKPFSLYKFRTIQENSLKAESLAGGKAEVEMTPLGRRLRHLKIDLLPQLFNILKGEMSFVGPRPEDSDYVALFQKEYETIFKILPGITDLASIAFINETIIPPVSDRTQTTDTHFVLPKKTKLALAYVGERSFLLDLKILSASFLNFVLSFPSPFREKGTPGKQEIRTVIFNARAQIIFVAHSIAIILCNYAAFWLRFDGNIPAKTFDLFLSTIPLVFLVRMGVLYLFGLNRGLWRYAGLRDLLTIVGSVVTGTVLIWGAITLLPWQGYPRSIYLIDTVLLLVVFAMLRSPKRVCSILTHTGVGGRRILIVGAGNAGEMIARDMCQDRRYGCRPLAFIDDDPDKRFKKIHNIPVAGNCEEMEKIVAKVRPDELLIAIPSAKPGEIKRIMGYCKVLNLPIKTLPNVAAMLGGNLSMMDIRSLDIEDLLGRAEIQIDDPALSEKIREKKVLITGAGGSIGSELCRQLAVLQPKQLILLERHENNLYQIEMDLREHFSGLKIEGILADICDAEKMDQVFSEFRPQMVFHAAAYKHVPMMERSPLDAIRNNILGTHQMISKSNLYGVDEFVLISTDKAVSPSSVMGATKRIAEMMIRYFDSSSQTKLVSVRFGNVLESAGSVVPLFRSQIKRGGPVKVTHVDVKRYFISIKEAVQLVLQASLLGKGGEIFVLDMGEPIKILDLAKKMITLSGFSPERDIPIQIIGLRPGEKLHEGLFEVGEEVKQTQHDKIRLAKKRKVSVDLPSYIERFAKMNNHTSLEEIKSLLKELIPKYQYKTACPQPNFQAVKKTAHLKTTSLKS